MSKKITKAIERQVKKVGYFTGELLPEPDEHLSLDARVKKLLNENIKGHADPVLVEIFRKQIKRALAGNLSAAEFLMDRGYGKAIQSITVAQPPPITVTHNVISIENILPNKKE